MAIEFSAENVEAMHKKGMSAEDIAKYFNFSSVRQLCIEVGKDLDKKKQK